MAFSVKDPETDQAVRRLAQLKKITLTDTIREAVEAEYQRLNSDVPLVERLERLAVKYRSFPERDLSADKSFFDDLSGGI